MSNQKLIKDIKNQLLELKNTIKQQEPFETYNYGRCFYLNDKSYVQFEKCNKILLDMVQKLNDEIGREYQKTIDQQIDKASDEDLIKTEQYLDQLLQQQDFLMNQIQQNVRAMSLSQLITKNTLFQNLYMVNLPINVFGITFL